MVCAGTHAGAGIHPELQALAMYIICNSFHAVREFIMVCHDFIRNRVTVVLGPAVVDDEVLISCVKQSLIDHSIRRFTDHLIADVCAKGVPGIKAHRWCLCCHTFASFLFVLHRLNRAFGQSDVKMRVQYIIKFWKMQVYFQITS